jgi:serine/threonine protein kinase
MNSPAFGKVDLEGGAGKSAVGVTPKIEKPKPEGTTLKLSAKRLGIKDALDGEGRQYVPKTKPHGDNQLPNLGSMGKKTEWEEPIGRGGFGDVYKVKIGDKDYAVKVLRKDPKAADGVYEQAALREIDYSDFSNANSKGTPFYGAVKLEDDSYALVYQLQKGSLSSLKTDLETFLGLGKTYEPQKFWKGAEDLAEGLGWYHKKGRVYRDWKRDNILVTHEGGLQIGDYGSLKTMTSDVTSSHSGSYTLAYTSPWRSLGAEISLLKKARRKLTVEQWSKKGGTSLRARKKLEKMDAEIKQKQQKLTEYQGVRSAEELMIRDDIYAYSASLFEL